MYLRHTLVLAAFAVCLPLGAEAHEAGYGLPALVAAIQKAGGPDVSGLTYSIGSSSPEWAVHADAAGRPVKRAKTSPFVVKWGCSHYHSRRVLTYSCWIKVADRRTKEVMRIGTSRRVHTSPAAAMGEAFGRLNRGVTGRFNVTSGSGQDAPSSP